MRRTAVCMAILLVACSAEITHTGTSSSVKPDGAAALSPGSPPPPNPAQAPNACAGCTAQNAGVGGQPFDPTSHESDSVARDGDGALVIDKKATTSRHLWVADTTLPGVVKIDLATLQIVGRYVTGGSSTSRTTVNSLGEAFVGARDGRMGSKAGVTKLLPQGKGCPDTNGDGVVTTSTGVSDVLPYLKDDCVAWYMEADGDIRGLAAQDISGIKHEDVCQGWGGESKEFNPKEVTTEDEHYVWVGGVHGKVYKLEAKTGKILLKTSSPVQVYGMALSGDGKLWVGSGGGGFGYIDTKKCTDQALCDAAKVCTQTCTATACGNSCDGAVKAAYTGMPGGYGITVDYKQRVWRSGSGLAMAMRYDPGAPVNQRLTIGTVGSSSGGIAVDADGWVWGANMGSTVRVNAETLAGVSVAAPSKGVATDAQGRVFAIELGGAVHMIEPGKTLAENKVTKNVVPLKGTAYAYSDMTGVQTRLASGAPGWYRDVFQPCKEGATEWKFLTYDVEAPQGTWVMFNLRSADTADALKQAAWFTVACVSPPGGKGSAAISSLKSKLVEVEARFVATGDLSKPGALTSARIKSFGVLQQCTKVD